MAKIKHHKKLEAIYRIEFAEEITGKSRYALWKRMQREEITLAETVKRYLIETLCNVRN